MGSKCRRVNHILLFCSLVALLVFCAVNSALATIYTYKSPAVFQWVPATGNVAHYNVYLAINNGLLSAYAQVITNSCSVAMQYGNSYIIRVEAVNSSGVVGPLSDPSDVVVFTVTTTTTQPISSTTTSTSSTTTTISRSTTTSTTTTTHPITTTTTTLPKKRHPRAVILPQIQSAQSDLSNEQLPIAKAGPYQWVLPGNMAILDGSGSYSPCGDTLEYSWNQIAGPSVELKDTGNGRAQFQASIEGVYGFNLKVFDGTQWSQPDMTVVYVSATPPPGCSVALMPGAKGDMNGIIFIGIMLLPLAFIRILQKSLGKRPGASNVHIEL